MSYWERLRSWWNPPLELSIPADVSRLIASAYGLKTTDIVHLCKTQRQFNNAICQNEDFWRALAKERLSEHLEGKSLAEIKRDLIDAEYAIERITEIFKQSPFLRRDEKQFITVYAEKGYEKVLSQMMDIIATSRFPSAKEDILSMIYGVYINGRGKNLSGILEALSPYFTESYFRTTCVRLIQSACKAGINYADELLPYIAPNDPRFVSYIKEYFRDLRRTDPECSELLRRIVDYIPPESRESMAVHSERLQNITDPTVREISRRLLELVPREY